MPRRTTRRPQSDTRLSHRDTRRAPESITPNAGTERNLVGIAVADVYDSLTSDRRYRRAMSPFDAKRIIEKAAGAEFDPLVVEAFLTAFRSGELDTRSTAIAVA